MRKLLTVLFLALASASAHAGCVIGGGFLCKPPVASSYTGPGDVVSGARFWYGLRAYSNATAGTAAARICNASDANCADVNTLSDGSFDVATATGAPLNCGGAGGTCTIHTLYDQTGNNACTAATCNVLNTTIGNRPTLTFNCIGSLPCMTFTSASSQVLSSATNLTSTSQPNSLSGAAQTTNTGTARHLVGTNGAGANQIGYTTTNNFVQAYAGANLGVATATAGSYHALQAVLNGTPNSAISVDGAYSGGNAGGQAMTGIISVGAINASQYMSGQILEAGGWNGVAFSSGQASSMSANQRSYWGF